MLIVGHGLSLSIGEPRVALCEEATAGSRPPAISAKITSAHLCNRRWKEPMQRADDVRCTRSHHEQHVCSSRARGDAATMLD